MGAPADAVLLLGRAPETAMLYDALAVAAQGTSQTVLVGGDAGIGKTTLVDDLQRRAIELGFTAVVGHCLDIEAGMSFAPVIEAVRALAEQMTDVRSSPAARRVLALLDPESPKSVEPPQVLDDLRQTVLEAAGEPLVLVLEDVHWADRSTQDFVASLVRTARGHLLLVLTFRSDDLHRRHPFRRTLGEISRTHGTRRLDLDPLDRESIAGIVANRTGRPADPSLVGSVLARSEGNPLYAEELLATDRPAMPGHLADLFLARLDALGKDARALLRLASVDGTRVDTDVLKQLAGSDHSEMSRLLREGVDANVLRQNGGSLEFRHGLLREAVYDDLMPDERNRIHSDLAQLLQERVDSERKPGLSELSRLAFHWNAAHDLPRTVAASVRAGLAAKHIGAAEAMTNLERALSLWDRVPDAEAVAGLTKLELLVVMAEAAKDQGDVDRWHGTVREAVAVLRADTDPLLASRVYSALGECFLFTDETVDRATAIRLAVERAGQEPTEELARALVAESSYRISLEQFAASLETATKAAEVASAAACVDAQIHALGNSAEALQKLGSIEKAIATQQEGIRVARSNERVGRALADVASLAWTLITQGQIDRGLTLARQGFEEALALGFASRTALCGEQVQRALVWQGRLEEAKMFLADLEVFGMPPYRWRFLRTDLLLALGDPEAAAPLIRETDRVWKEVSGTPEDNDVLAQIRLAEMIDAAPSAVQAAKSYLDRLDRCDSPLRAACAARIGFQALSLVGPAPGVDTAVLQDLTRLQLQRAQAGLTSEWRHGYYGLQLALAESWSARITGEAAVTPLREAGTLASQLGAFLALEPRLLLAEELLTRGERDEGRELLIAVWGDAHAIGAGDHERRAARLARRRRVPLTATGSTTGPLGRLTARETEVLDLLVEGATNRAIAEALFISEKTASVHVSRVLSKLGVPNRGAAAALARRWR